MKKKDNKEKLIFFPLTSNHNHQNIIFVSQYKISSPRLPCLESYFYPNYKYIFYLSLAFGIWGVIDSLIGVIRYFQASGEAEQLRRRVKELEREL